MSAASRPPPVAGGHDFVGRLLAKKYDVKDPDPFLAMFLDRSMPMDDQAKAAVLLDQQSFSRQFLLPMVRPFARLAIILVQILKFFIPRAFTSSKLLHKFIRLGLEYFVSPAANYIILRHFHLGSEILGFVGSNVPCTFEGLESIRPRVVKDAEDEIFLKHDLNLYNFVIQLNRQLRDQGIRLGPPETLRFDAISTDPIPIEKLPDRWTNVIDLATAIEIYTPLYQLFLTDHDFWRASNSLQLDETVGIYVASLLGDATHVGLVNNKHPLVPLSTMRAAFRLMIHGLAAECLHALLVAHKRGELNNNERAMGLRAFWNMHGA